MNAFDGASETAPVLVLGATSQVGDFLLPRLLDAGAPVIAVSRNVPGFSRPGLTWMQQDVTREPARVQGQVMISAGPLALALRQARGIPRLRRIVALGSASVRFKHQSPDPHERHAIESLTATERELAELAERRAIDITLLRPTLIYGGPGPSALSSIRAWVKRRNWAPVAGRGERQPVHADDLAALMFGLVGRHDCGFETFDLGGGEALPYPEFVRWVASSTGRDPRLLPLPPWLITPALRLAHAVGRLEDITPAMVARQRMDLVVDDTPAREQLGWNPRPFRP